MNNRSAFTMIELVFVIVVLGILAAIAVPKFSATRDDAEVAKIRSDIASIRSAIISERQLRLLRGEVQYLTELDQNVASNTPDVGIFDGNDTTHTLLQYPIMTSTQSGKWMKIATNQYNVNAGGTVVTFTYTPANGRFDCNQATANCRMLTN